MNWNLIEIVVFLLAIVTVNFIPKKIVYFPKWRWKHLSGKVSKILLIFAYSSIVFHCSRNNIALYLEYCINTTFKGGVYLLLWHWIILILSMTNIGTIYYLLKILYMSKHLVTQPCNYDLLHIFAFVISRCTVTTCKQTLTVRQVILGNFNRNR